MSPKTGEANGEARKKEGKNMWGKIMTVLFACMLFTACGTPTKEPAPNQPNEESPTDEQNIAPENDDMEDELFDERDDMDDNTGKDRMEDTPGETDDNDGDRTDDNDLDMNEDNEDRNDNER